MIPACQESGDLLNDTSIEGVHWNLRQPRDFGRRQFLQKFPRVPMRIDCRSARELQSSMQSGRTGHPHFDPGGSPPSQISNENRRFVSRRNAFGEEDSLAILKAIRENSHEHVFERLGRLTRHPKRQLLVDATIHVGQVDIEVMNGCG